MSKLTGVSEVEFIARVDKNLDTTCYRGVAPLAHLALISQADVFDQVDHPDGLQRDLSPKHASDAYEYVSRIPDPDYPRAFPEVVLNVRKKGAVEIEPVDLDGFDAGVELVRMRFSIDNLTATDVVVSRVDGNHRLYYAGGDERRDPILQSAPFQIHVGLTRGQERQLFVDINSNQKGLNTSHLAVMQSKLTSEDLEIRDHLDRWITNELVKDPNSPWHGLIHLGGSKKGARAQGLTRPINFTSLQTGVAKTLAKSQYVHDLTNPHAQYAVIRNYWQAVKTVFAEEWAEPKSYLLLKNIGVTSLSILGGTIIDRCMPRGLVGVDDFAFYLRQARNRFDWGPEVVGERAVSGMSGNRAATIIAAAMAQELTDDTGSNIIRDLEEKLTASPA